MVYKLSFVFLALVLLLFLLVAAVYHVIYAKGEQYEKRALSQQTYVSAAIPYKRGEIQDRNGTVFARSEQVYDLIISPKDILYTKEDKKSGEKIQKYREPAINALEQYFGYGREEIEAILKEKPGSMYYRLAEELDAETVEAYKEARKQEEEAVKARNKKKKKGEKRKSLLILTTAFILRWDTGGSIR